MMKKTEGEMKMDKYHVLVVEDDKEIRDAIEIYLKSQEYEVFKAADGIEGLEIIYREEIHLAIVDVMMPRKDGIQMVMEMRKDYDFPVIMLSAKSEEVDKILGLNMGADDYVTKPFPISVFQKKVSALLNRISAQSGGDFYDDGNLYINFSELSACLAGQPITLTSLEYRLLKVLIRNSQTVLTRQVLLEKLWDADENYVDEHALTTTISRIRSKIETNQHSYIKTVYGMGYMWIGGAQK